MNPSLERRVDALEKAHAAHCRTHYLFRGMDETHAQVQVRIRAMIASGEASRNDRFVTFSWLPPADDGC
jgi:hypothetical protein